MVNSLGTFLAYVALKYVAYSIWSGLGVGWLGGQRLNVVRSGLGLGLVRLLIGVGAGFAVFMVGGIMHWDVWPNPFLQYLSVYAPVRWFEWGLMELLVVSANRRWQVRILIGGNNQSRLWRIGGILISHVADIPLILSSGGLKEMLPVGRFLC